MTLIPTTAPQDEATTDLVRALRADVIPAAVAGTGIDVHVTGSAATNIDVTDYLGDRMPLFFAAVLGMSFLVLMMVFRSILVPLKAVVMNVLSIAATYGVVVVVFQWGWGGSLLGIEGGPINPFIPLMLFAIVFGLSMDYEVFMLSRIREEYDRTGDATTSVADGLASTARVITAAAAIMVVVFGSFLFEEIREIKLFGLGLAPRRAARRHPRPHDPGARHDGPARRSQLVDAPLARPGPAPAHDRRRTGRSRASADRGADGGAGAHAPAGEPAVTAMAATGAGRPSQLSAVGLEDALAVEHGVEDVAGAVGHAESVGARPVAGSRRERTRSTVR